MKRHLVRANKVVSISYTLTDEKGQILDVASPDTPLHYLHGAGFLLPPVEAALEGLGAKERRELVLEPAQAYGDYDARHVQEIPRAAFGDAEPRVGMPFVLELAGGGQGGRPYFVKEVKQDVVLLDGNHPLAGRTLHFDITVERVRNAAPEELATGRVRPPEEGLR
jgi:FKBP-type peptidyl-prolyl cis-trans isomerase SlyD